jgi:exodeoxyribonuclease V alpha subunit
VPTTLSGEVERVTYENEQTGFRVLRLGSLEGAGNRRGPIVVVGAFQAVGPGTRVRVTGEFVVDPRHGEQFKADVLITLDPTTIEGLTRYLGSGIIPGIGPVYAKRIVDTFGLETMGVLDQQPQRLSEVNGLGTRRVEQIKGAWSSQRAVSSIMMLLQAHGASPKLALSIYKHYGDRAASVVQRSPYRLALDVRGIGFKTADKLARSLGIAGDHPERAQAGVLHELGTLVEQGHTYVQRDELVTRAANMLEIDEGHAQAAVDALWASERVVVEDGAVYSTRLYRAELSVSRHLGLLIEDEQRPLPAPEAALAAFEAESKIELSASQREAVLSVARHRVVVITGGPGVGKTTIVRAILQLLSRQRFTIRLAAPTGRAAKRLSESTKREAVTLHRLLEFDPRLNRFTRDEQAPLDADVVIVDEASMIDMPLAQALLESLPRTARLVIVGDADQLPSVGPGAFLRDVIDSRVVPTMRLGEIFRQAGESRIVTNAHRILHGEPPESVDPDATNPDFFVIARRDPEDAAEVVRELVLTRIPRRFGFDARRDVQVLTPMHRGAAGTIALNQSLQAALNPEGPSFEYRGTTFRVGDKVMQLKNDYDREVYNGDLGEVASVDADARELVVRFDQREVDYDEADLDALALAYATSIHKSQGSEYPVVVIPLLTAHFVMLSRNLVYTAVTRARKLCILVADPRALKLALGEVRREERKTRLAERLRAAVRG